jgi:hypothetical protein
VHASKSESPRVDRKNAKQQRDNFLGASKEPPCFCSAVSLLLFLACTANELEFLRKFLMFQRLAKNGFARSFQKSLTKLYRRGTRQKKD